MPVSDSGSFHRKQPWRLAGGPPMTLGNMRANGVRSLDVSSVTVALKCHRFRFALSPRQPPIITCSKLAPGRTVTVNVGGDACGQANDQDHRLGTAKG